MLGSGYPSRQRPKQTKTARACGARSPQSHYWPEARVAVGTATPGWRLVSREEGLAQRAEVASWVQPASPAQPQRQLPTRCSHCGWWWRDKKSGGTAGPGAPCGTPTALLSRARPPSPSTAVPARHAMRIPGRGWRQPLQLGRCAGQGRPPVEPPPATGSERSGTRQHDAPHAHEAAKSHGGHLPPADGNHDASGGHGSASQRPPPADCHAGCRQRGRRQWEKITSRKPKPRDGNGPVGAARHPHSAP